MVEVGDIGQTLGGIFTWIGKINYQQVFIMGIFGFLFLAAVYYLWEINYKKKKYVNDEIWR